MAATFKKRLFGENVTYDVIREFQKLEGGGVSTTDVRDEAGMPVIVKGEGRILQEVS